MKTSVSAKDCFTTLLSTMVFIWLLVATQASKALNRLEPLLSPLVPQPQQCAPPPERRNHPPVTSGWNIFAEIYLKGGLGPSGKELPIVGMEPISFLISIPLLDVPSTCVEARRVLTPHPGPLALYMLPICIHRGPPADHLLVICDPIAVRGLIKSVFCVTKHRLSWIVTLLHTARENVPGG